MAELPSYFDHVIRRWTRFQPATLAACGRFTRIVAYDLANGIDGAPRDPRVGLWRKRSESTVQDRDADKLCFALGAGRVAWVDIVIGKHTPNPQPSWQEPVFGLDGAADAFERWVAPEPEPGVHDLPDDPPRDDPREPPHPPQEDPPTDPMLILVDTAGRILGGLDVIIASNLAIAERLDSIARDVAAARAEGVKLRIGR